MENIITSKNKTFLAFCFCFLLGVAMISLIDKQIDFVYLYFIGLVSIGFLVIFWRNKLTRFFLLCIIFFAFGIARYLFSFPTDSTHHVSRFVDKQITFVGYIVAEPDIRIDGVRYIVEATKRDTGAPLHGRVYVKMPSYPRYDYGDVLSVYCQLEKPEPIDNGDTNRVFHYEKYLATFQVFAICREPIITKIGTGEGSRLYQNLFTFKKLMAIQITKLWHEPYAGFMAGILYGYRGGLGNLNDVFAAAGVSHIVAVSGYNISIVVSVLGSPLIYMRVPRKKAFFGLVFGIFLFVLFTGASGSVVRAGIMGFLVLLAKQFGRLSRVGNVLVFTAVFMTLHNPFILVWDIGFQLSFLSTMGLVYLSPLFEKFFAFVPEYLGLKDSFVSTIAAIIATLPLILYQFGIVSAVAPLVNVLILWIIPWLMLCGASAVVVSFLYFPIGNLLAWIPWFGMKYVVGVVEWFASLRFASFQLIVPWWGMALLYVVIGGLAYYFSKKTKEEKMPTTL